MLTVIHNIPTDLAWLSFNQPSLLWTSAFPQAWASTKRQTFLAPLTAHSKNQLTTERNTSCHTAPSCCLFIHPHLLPHHTHTHTHTHRYTNSHTQSCCSPCLSFHVKEISFSVPFWDMLRTCVQNILPIAISSLQSLSRVRLFGTPWVTARQASLSIPNSAFRCLYLCFAPLLFASLLFTAICKASPDSHCAFLHFFSMGMVLIPVSCTMSWTSFHSSSGTPSIRSGPLNLFLTSTT